MTLPRTTTANTSGNGRSQRYQTPGIILAAVSVAQFMVVVDIAIVNIALPDAKHDLHLSVSSLTWIINAYTLAFAGFLLFGGRAADLWGRRRMFMVGLSVFTIMSLLGGLSQNGGELIAARALQGLGAAALSPAILSILTTTFTEDKARARALGIWAAVGGAGGAFGVLLGGVITDLLSWRWVLFINVPIGVALLVVASVAIPTSGAALSRAVLDWGGAVSVTLGLGALTFGVVESDSHGWSSGFVLAFLIAGGLLLAAFLAIESRHKQPLVPLRLFRTRALTGANLMMLMIVPPLVTTTFFLTQYLQIVHGYSPLKTGLCFLPMPLGFISGAQTSSRLVAKIGPWPLLIAGPVIGAAGLFWMAQVTANDSWAGHISVPSAITMFGIAMSFIPITLSANRGVDPADAGLASGVINTSQQVGGALGLAVISTIATSRAHALSHSPANVALTGGYSRGFEVAAALMLVAVLIAVTVMPRRLAGPAAVGAAELSDDPVLGDMVAYEPASAALLAADQVGAESCHAT